MLTYNFTKTSGYKSFNEKSTLITLDTDTIYRGVGRVTYSLCVSKERFLCNDVYLDTPAVRWAN